MDIASSIQGLGAAGAAAAIAWKQPELLKEIYGDLAKPGVVQVGRALETVLSTGSLVLLPLRLLNEKAREFEQRNFSQIADKLSTVPEDRIIDMRPELGVPLLEGLSQTQDQNLRGLFLELLRKSADRDAVSLVHPSFCHVISSLSPDEAQFIEIMFAKKNIPFLSLNKMVSNGAHTEVGDFIFNYPDELQFPEKIPLYLANMEGHGLIQIDRESYLSDEKFYQDLIDHVKQTYPECTAHKLLPRLGEGTIFYQKCTIRVTNYGHDFFLACTE